MDQQKSYILIVEDDKKLARLVKEYLDSKGYRTEIESRGDKASERIVVEQPDMVLLDIMLPGMDGLTVCKSVRPKYRGPIMMLTALNEEIDEIVGLEVGADDYIAKPALPRLLLARIKSVLRRFELANDIKTAGEGNGQSSISHPRQISVGQLQIDSSRRLATAAGKELDLTTAEFDLLWLLMNNAGIVLTRDEIYRELRGIDYDGLDRSIDLRIARLRKKIGDDAKNPHMIKSVRSVGYLLVADND